MTDGLEDEVDYGNGLTGNLLKYRGENEMIKEREGKTERERERKRRKAE